MTKIPDEYKSDVERAIKILKKNRCKKIYLFGTMAKGKANLNSDIDLAVEECPEGRFFAIYAELIMELDHPVDLINLGDKDAFSKFLIQENELKMVA